MLLGVHDDESSDDMDDEPTMEDGQGHRGPRRKKRVRNPYKSMFWTKYIETAISADPTNTESIWCESQGNAVSSCT